MDGRYSRRRLAKSGTAGASRNALAKIARAEFVTLGKPGSGRLVVGVHASPDSTAGWATCATAIAVCGARLPACTPVRADNSADRRSSRFTRWDIGCVLCRVQRRAQVTGASSARSPQRPHRISPHGRISRDEHQIGLKSVRQQHSVDRVAVKLRQLLSQSPQRRGRVQQGDIQRIDGVIEMSRCGQPASGVEIGILERGNGADEQRLARLDDLPAGGRAQSSRSAECPDQHMRIKQDRQASAYDARQDRFGRPSARERRDLFRQRLPRTCPAPGVAFQPAELWRCPTPARQAPVEPAVTRPCPAPPPRPAPRPRSVRTAGSLRHRCLREWSREVASLAKLLGQVAYRQDGGKAGAWPTLRSPCPFPTCRQCPA